MSRRPTAAETSARWHVDLRTAQRWHAGQGKHHPPPAALAAGEPGAAAMLTWFAHLPSAIQSKLSRPFRAQLTRLRIAHERGAPLASAFGPSAPPSEPHPLSPDGSEGAARRATSHPAPPHAQTAPSAPAPGAHAHPIPTHPATPGGAYAPAHTPRPPAPGLDDPDYTTFLATPHATALAAALATAPPAQATIASLRLQRAFADHKVSLCNRRGDTASAREWMEQLRHLSSVLYDEETLAQRLQRDLGDSLPRATVEQLLRALAYWLARSADDTLAALTAQLAAATAPGAPLYREELRRLLEPHLLNARLLEPLRRARAAAAPSALAPWVHAALETALAATIEDPDWRPSEISNLKSEISDSPANANPPPAPLAETPPSVSANQTPAPAAAPSPATPDLGPAATQPL